MIMRLAEEIEQIGKGRGGNEAARHGGDHPRHGCRLHAVMKRPRRYDQVKWPLFTMPENYFFVRPFPLGTAIGMIRADMAWDA
jgi:hypothetical protein